MGKPKKRNFLTLKQKLNIIELCASSNDRKQIMADYGVPSSTLSKILKAADQIREQGSENPRRLNMKTFKPPKEPE